MATAVATFTWANFKDQLKAYLGLTGDASEDVQLELWLGAAAQDLDDLAQWYFVDADGDTVDDTPTDPSTNASWTLGIYEWVKAFRAAYSSPVTDGAKSVKTGVLQENYQGGDSGMAANNLARQAALPHWYTAIRQPLRAPQAV